MSKVLIVDDERKILSILRERISADGHQVATGSSGTEAMKKVEEERPDIILCDLKLGDMEGIDLLRKVKKRYPDIEFIIMTAYASTSTAVTAMQEGAYEYLTKPFRMEEVSLLLSRIEERQNLISENRALREKASTAGAEDKMIGESEEIEEVREKIKKVAPTSTPVLIRGESGTGKEIAAELIHLNSPRAENPFIAINCAAVPATLLESELFGYEKGAFTGADGRKPGLFKLADGGTLFLDEIGDMPLQLQAKLLRVLENGEILPVGGSSTVKVDVRIVAATNRELSEMQKEGSFRDDLLYRLNVFPVLIPPLRMRKSDIPLLASHFLKKLGRPQELSPEIARLLSRYHWPGNVRELRNVLERAVILAGPEDISEKEIQFSEPSREQSPESCLHSLLGERTLEEIEEEMVRGAIEKTGGNKSKAAEILGITRRVLYGKLKKYGIDSDEIG
jgi:two-component system NtrC family response regulator